jgi:UDP-glucose 4-epimerase
MNVFIFRFFNVFGPKQSPEGQYAAVIPKWILNLSQNKSIEIFGNGNQTRDFTPVQTVVEVLVKSIESRFSYPMPINLAYGTSTSLNSLVEILKTFFPELECKFSKIRTSDILDSKSDGILINKLFPEIAPLDFKQAIIETIEYSRNLSLKN